MSDINHGWIPGDITPVVDQEGESDFKLVLGRGFTAPTVAYYLDPMNGSDGGWKLYPTGGKVEVRWYKAIDKIPASLFPPTTHRWAIESGVAFDDSEGEQDDHHH